MIDELGDVSKNLNHCCFRKMTKGERVQTPNFSSPAAQIEPGTSSFRGQCAHHWATKLLSSFKPLLKTPITNLAHNMLSLPWASSPGAVTKKKFGQSLLWAKMFS